MPFDWEFDGFAAVFCCSIAILMVDDMDGYIPRQEKSPEV
jgi:hypothetical protein